MYDINVIFYMDDYKWCIEMWCSYRL